MRAVSRASHPRMASLTLPCCGGRAATPLGHRAHRHRARRLHARRLHARQLHARRHRARRLHARRLHARRHQSRRMATSDVACCCRDAGCMCACVGSSVQGRHRGHAGGMGGVGVCVQSAAFARRAHPGCAWSVAPSAALAAGSKPAASHARSRASGPRARWTLAWKHAPLPMLCVCSCTPVRLSVRLSVLRLASVLCSLVSACLSCHICLSCSNNICMYHSIVCRVTSTQERIRSSARGPGSQIDYTHHYTYV